MKAKAKITASLAALFLSACGPSFQAANQLSCGTACYGNNSSGGATDPGTKTPDSGSTTEPSQAWKDLQVDAAVRGGSFDNTQVVGIDKTTKELIVRLPMLANIYIDGVMAEIPVTQLPGARLTLDPLPSGGSALVLRIPLKYVMKGVDFLPPSKLPNGDPLPQIPSGELPSLAIQLTKVKDIKAAIYLAPTFVGLFVNTPFADSVPFRVSFPIRDAARRTFGYFTFIPAKPNVADAGFFLSVALPDDLARIIDDNL